MNSKVIDTGTVKKAVRPILALVGSLLAYALVALAGGANASPLAAGSGNGVPLPPPTVPPTVAITSPTPVPTIAGCTMTFTDVLSTDWFYEPVQWMLCHGIVSGYADNTFRPGNATTRGQIMKIAVGAFNLPAHVDSGPHFADVPAAHTFYSYVETAYFYSIVNGYPCGGVGEPCDADNHPYFRPGVEVTRGQLTKIAVLTAILTNPTVWELLSPAVPTFADVAPGSPFYGYVETAVAHNILQGYDCGAAGEPCPGRYFRSNSNSTRAQLSKIVYRAVVQP
ncbi:MAG: S-layer homology domain-containing protein [Chloroflexota bacterium]